MIYLDTSVALAELFAEDRHPPLNFWEQDLVSSRLLEYELWNAVHRRRLQKSHGESARRVVESIAIAELSREILQRATEPFPRPVRTLDAMHLSTLLFLRDQGIDIGLAAYDRRMIESAGRLEIPVVEC
ncbi:MAG TPA: PIN domain-containing protein [Thermoanaerobaculia bacterium]|nr:PIN domain-containing protein [Thermoanaerobaculia bacterium]